MSRFYEEVMGVYFDDLDAFRILHNARYLLLFERTLGAFWESVGVTLAGDLPDHWHLVRANHVEYLRAVRGTGRVRVRVWIEAIGRTSLTFGFRIMPLDEDVDYAVGSRAVVRVDPTTQRPVPWSDGFRTLLADWLP
jgi:acyl-CoA thioester hydrolase